MGGERFRARQYPWGTVLGESDMKCFYNFWICFSRYISNLVLQDIYLQLFGCNYICPKAPNPSSIVCLNETNTFIDFRSMVKSILHLSQYIILKIVWRYTEYLIFSIFSVFKIHFLHWFGVTLVTFYYYFFHVFKI